MCGVEVGSKYPSVLRFFLFKILYYLLKGGMMRDNTQTHTQRERKRQRERYFSYACSLPKWPQQSKLDLKEARSLELHPSLPHRWQGASTWVILHCFGRCIRRELDRKLSCQDLSWHSDKTLA